MIKATEGVCLRMEEEKKKNAYRMSIGKSPFGRL
jgi:hypothetical protein